MKFFKLLLLTTVIFLCGCSSSDTSLSESTVTPSASPSLTPTPTPSLSNIDDEVFSCSYDSTLLQCVNNVSTSSIKHGISFAGIDSDMASSVRDGNCVYACVIPYDSETSERFHAYTELCVSALFTGVFNTPDSCKPIMSSTDGVYEYTITLDGYNCKGKLLGYNNETYTVLIYKVSESEEPELIDAFNNVYDTLTLKSNYDTPSDTILSEADELAKSSVKITEGPLYDSITSICQDVSLTEISGSLCINIYLNHDTVNSDAFSFFTTVASIIKECNIETYYSSIDFCMFVDHNMVCTFILTDYASPASFNCSKPVVLVDGYKSIISKIYTSVFASYDISNQFDEKLDALKKQLN